MWWSLVWLIHFGSHVSREGENHHDKSIYYGFDEWLLPVLYNYQAIVSMKDAGEWNFSLQITIHPVWQEKWISIFNILLWIKANRGRATVCKLWRIGWIWKSACLNEVAKEILMTNMCTCNVEKPDYLRKLVLIHIWQGRDLTIYKRHSNIVVAITFLII